jgi:hypothetical protein
LEQQRLAQEQAELEARQSQRMRLCIILVAAVAVIAVIGLLLTQKYRK